MIAVPGRTDEENHGRLHRRTRVRHGVIKNKTTAVRIIPFPAKAPANARYRRLLGEYGDIPINSRGAGSTALSATGDASGAAVEPEE